QYADKESGLYYNLNRYYDPGIGRYLTADLVKLAGGLNPYQYVDGNPVGWVDPLGLFKQDSTGFENSTPKTKELGTPDVFIPRDRNGKPIPLDKQRVNGQDIPLPHPDAEGRAHTVLGGKVSSSGGIYRQSAEFPENTWPLANGKPVPWSEVHWGDHGTPQHHTNPHQHTFRYVGDKWMRLEPIKYPGIGSK
ncbi:RHS repeat-associated core domain-containing protein, partial [Serratia fonticola]|uniref:RHS repeat-associated core domain-containing protein n=1 Tax=Serratia fonticola TaxID=47917 RepID=UPI00293E85F0